MLMPRKDASAKARSPSIVPPRARKPPTSDLPYVLRHFTLSIRMLVCSTLWARRKEECFDRALEGGNCNDAREDGATLAKRHGPQPTRPRSHLPCLLPRPTQLIPTSIIRSTCMVPYGCSTGIPLRLCFGSIEEVHRAGGTNVPSSSVGSYERGQRLSNYQSRESDPMSRIETSFNAY